MSDNTHTAEFLSIPEPLCSGEPSHEAIGAPVAAGTVIASLRWFTESKCWCVEFTPDVHLGPQVAGKTARWLLVVTAWLEVHEFDAPMWANRKTHEATR